MAITLKCSASRRHLTTLGVLQLCGVFFILALIQRDMTQGEIFLEEHEWRPLLQVTEINIRPLIHINKSTTKTKPTWAAPVQSEISKILTIFTTFQDKPDYVEIYNNTLYNWAAHLHHVQPVLYLDGKLNATRQWRTLATQLGWHVRNVSHTIRGIPILKHMFLDILESYGTPFYGYANPDILFDHSLVRDMRLHETYLQAYEAHGGLLLTGRRIDVTLDDDVIMNVTTMSNLTFLGDVNGTQAKSYLEDYLITTREALPWRHTPDLVVGQAGYGNWLVVKAQLCNVTVIDASYTLRALHQTRLVDRYLQKWEFQRCINKKLVGKSPFDCSKGVTECAPYVSHTDESGVNKLYKRPERPSKCHIEYTELCEESLDRYSLDEDDFSIFNL